MADEQTSIFEAAGAAVAAGADTALRMPSAPPYPQAREDFMAGMFAQWAAIDRGGPSAKPTAEEKRRGREGAKSALGEFLR